MKKFSFELEPLLRMRLWQEDQAKRNLGWVQRDLFKRQEELEKLLYEREAQVLNTPQEDPLLYLTAHAYLDYLDKQKDRKIQQIENLEKNLEKKREELQKAIVDRKKLDQLQDKAKEEYRIETNRQEAKRLDEVAGDRSWQQDAQEEPDGGAVS